MKTISTAVIEILWKGPYKLEKLNEIDEIFFKFNDSKFINKGLYQIYGTHPLTGRNSLLYIGKTTDGFEVRMNDHYKTWLDFEYDEVTVHIGVLGCSEISEIKIKKYNEMLREAENLLIYMCQPPYNSSQKTELKINRPDSHITLFNYGRKGIIPTELSTYWYSSPVWKKAGNWKPFLIEE